MTNLANQKKQCVLGRRSPMADSPSPDSLYEELREWEREASEVVNSPTLTPNVGDLRHAARLKAAIEEIGTLRKTLQTIKTIAGSEPHRTVSQQGYGDIEELCDVALSLRCGWLPGQRQ